MFNVSGVYIYIYLYLWVPLETTYKLLPWHELMEFYSRVPYGVIWFKLNVDQSPSEN